MRKVVQTFAIVLGLAAAAWGQLYTTTYAPAVSMVTVTLSSADVRALHGTPVVLLPAQGAGVVVVVQSVVVRYAYNTTAYTVPGGSNLKLYYGSSTSASPATFAAAGLLDQTANTVAVGVGRTVLSASGSAINQPLMLFNDNATEYTLGDGTVSVSVSYLVQ